jgi:triacylglycerol lipase
MMRVILISLSMMLFVPADEVVVLLHGLARSSKSMTKMEKSLEKEGYKVLNLDYPSRKHSVAKLARLVHDQVTAKTKGAKMVHFVTHSMGGILVRHIQANHPVKNLGRVVMLSPPNQGSEVIDKIGGLTVVKWINGPAGAELGTGPASIPLVLGPVKFELGVITGDRSINWINSSMIPGRDDGKVSVARAKVEGMKSFKIVHASHPFIMKKKVVIAEVLLFLKTGKFKDA